MGCALTNKTLNNNDLINSFIVELQILFFVISVNV